MPAAAHLPGSGRLVRLLRGTRGLDRRVRPPRSPHRAAPLPRPLSLHHPLEPVQPLVARDDLRAALRRGRGGESPSGAGRRALPPRVDVETLALQTLFAPQTGCSSARSCAYVLRVGARPPAPHRHRPRGGTEAMRALVRKGARCLDEGAWVVVFPEGPGSLPASSGRSTAAGRSRQAHRACHRADRAQLGGLLAAAPLHQAAGTIRLAIGPAIDTRDASPTELNRRAEDWIHARIASIRSRTTA